MQKINKETLRNFTKSLLNELKDDICLGEFEEIVFQLHIIEDRRLNNISAHSDTLFGEFKSKDTIWRALKEIYRRAQYSTLLELEKFSNFLDRK